MGALPPPHTLRKGPDGGPLSLRWARKVFSETSPERTLTPSCTCPALYSLLRGFISVIFQISLPFLWGRVAGRDVVPLVQMRKLGEVGWPRSCHTGAHAEDDFSGSHGLTMGSSGREVRQPWAPILDSSLSGCGSREGHCNFLNLDFLIQEWE